MFRGKRLALWHVLLLTSYLLPGALSQSHAGFVPPIQTAHAAVPFPSTLNTHHPQAINYPVAKGFNGYPIYNTLGDYSYQPVDGQYWTGQQIPLYSPYQQYPQQYYNPQPYYPPYGQTWATPYSYPNYQFGNYFSQQSYGYIQPQTGYGNSYGQSPAFNPQYWTGVPAYHQTPYYGQPAYYDSFMYPSHPMMYPGHYYAPYPAHPFPIQEIVVFSEEPEYKQSTSLVEYWLVYLSELQRGGADRLNHPHMHVSDSNKFINKTKT